MGQVVKMERSLDDLVIKVRSHVFDAGRAHQTEAKHVLQAGVGLLELRHRVEAGEAGAIGWWEFFETKFSGHIKSRSYAEKLMRWAGADDPEAAIETERTRVRDATREYREKAARHVTRTDADLVEQALRLIDRMNEEQLDRFHSEYRSRFHG